jgi:hypothetical protein
MSILGSSVLSQDDFIQKYNDLKFNHKILFDTVLYDSPFTRGVSSYAIIPDHLEQYKTLIEKYNIYKNIYDVYLQLEDIFTQTILTDFLNKVIPKKDMELFVNKMILDHI